MPQNKKESSGFRDDEYLRDMPELEGFKVLGSVVIFAKLGQGGMGAVYRGKHLSLGIDVALKCLRADIAQENSHLVSRFQREARVAANINSPHLIRVYDVNESGRLHYLVMEFVQGESARERVQRKGALTLMESLAILSGAAKGLIAAHAKGIVHRDIKPDNIMISTEGEVKVADLGLAKALDVTDSLKTQTGMVMGTPSYMPPEQYQDASSVGPRADVYSLGATLYYLLAGKNGIAARALSEVMYMVCEVGIPDIRDLRPDLPIVVSEFIAKATAKDPNDRFQNVEALNDALESIAVIHRSKCNSKDLLGDKETQGVHQELESHVSHPPLASLARIKEKIRGLGGSDAKGDDSPALSLETAPAGETTSELEGDISQTPDDSNRRGVLIGVLGLLVLVSALILIFSGDESYEESKTRGDANSIKNVEQPIDENAAALENQLAPKIEATEAKLPELSEKSREHADLRALFESASQDVQRYATLKQGIEKMRKLKLAAPDYVGLNRMLSRSLIELAEKKLVEQALGGAIEAIVEAEAMTDSSDPQEVRAQIVEAIKAKLLSAVRIDLPEMEKFQNRREFFIQGRLDETALFESGLKGFKLQFMGQEVSVHGEVFRAHYKTMSDGDHAATFILSESNGISAQKTHRVQVDSTAPKLEIDLQKSPFFTNQKRLKISGAINDAQACKISAELTSNSIVIESQQADFSQGNSNWSFDFALKEGQLEVVLVARDGGGNERSLSRTILVNWQGPQISVEKLPRQTELGIVTIEGRVSQIQQSKATLRINGRIVPASNGGLFKSDLELKTGTNSIEILAVDEFGNETKELLEIFRKPVNPTAALRKLKAKLKLELKKIRRGSFKMGSPVDEKNRFQDETQHSVTFGNDFYVAKTETTHEQWGSVMKTSPWQSGSVARSGKEFAVNYVSWHDAQAFCARLNQLYSIKGWVFRLPTEAEWEYCCRAGSETTYFFGDSEAKLERYAWFGLEGKSGHEYAHKVAEKRANAWGLYDMHGNVWEWCQNGRYAYPNSVKQPLSSEQREQRAFRGGCWNDPASRQRSAYRNFLEPAQKNGYIGFRVVLVAR